MKLKFSSFIERAAMNSSLLRKTWFEINCNAQYGFQGSMGEDTQGEPKAKPYLAYKHYEQPPKNQDPTAVFLNKYRDKIKALINFYESLTSISTQL